MFLMKSSVVDVNVWVALLCSGHVHYRATREWADTLGPGEAGLCRIVQLSVVRLLGMPPVAGAQILTAQQAWSGMLELLEDERIEYLDEPPGVGELVPAMIRHAVPTPKLVTDAYLAAFAIASGRRLVTRDRGFLEFRGLDVELLV